MKTEYSLNRASQMIKMSKALKNEQFYLGSRKNRIDLASVFKQLMNCGSGFPARPLSMNNHLPTKLNRRISNSCPYCVKESKMRDYIKEAIQLINQYADTLKEWIEDSDFQDLPNDVHQLQPTKND